MEIVDIYGNKKEVNCIGCAITRGDIVAPGGIIMENDSFSAQQDYELPIPGFIIVGSKRHIRGVADFTEKEKSDYINILTKIRKAMKEALDIETIFSIQIEYTEHHFNHWLLPVIPEMQEKFGYGIKSVKPTLLLYAKDNMKTSENIQKLKDYFASK